MPWCAISSCNSFSTMVLYFSGYTSCVLFVVFIRRMPSSIWSLSHSRSRSLLCILRVLSSRPVGFLSLNLHCITGPMFSSSCCACWISVTNSDLCVFSLCCTLEWGKYWTDPWWAGVLSLNSLGYRCHAIWCHFLCTLLNNFLSTYRHSWQTVSIHIFLTWTVSDGKMEVCKLRHPSASSCIKLGTWQDIGKGIIISKYSESRRIIKVILEFFCDCPI